MKYQISNNRAKLIYSGFATACCVLAFAAGVQAAPTSVIETSCNSRLDVTVGSSTRSIDSSATDCQVRTLAVSSGFALSANSPSAATAVDSVAMVSAGGELYEAFVGSEREATVLLTPNRSLMMSRAITGDNSGVDWSMGLAVQPVSGSTNAWLTGTYTLLRANSEVRIVDATNQLNAALSEVFDPVTLRITFDGNSGCSIASYSSWLSYSLTTDPAGAFSQPDGDDYGLHQAVYAGEGYAGNGGVHEDSVRTFTDCDYVLSSDGKLLITYDYNDGDAVAHSVENSYFVSADLRYLVSTVDAGADLYRGFEVGVRVKAVSGTQDARNDGVAGTYLFNAPTLELQGATGVLSEPYNEHRAEEKATHCMARGSTILSTAASATSGWNTCTWDMTFTCSSRGEEGEVPAITLEHITAEGANASTACRFQVAANGSLDFVVNIETAEGPQDVVYSGAIADNNEGLVLRGKYVGSTMNNPSDTNPPEREIKNVMLLQALVGLKYEGTLTADADGDGLNNLGEFLYSNYASISIKNDYNASGKSDLFFVNTTTRANQYWEGAVKAQVTYPGAYGAGFAYAGSGDFNGDGTADLLFFNSATSATSIWNGAVKASATFPGKAAAGYSVAAVCDTNGDGLDDIVWRQNGGTGLSIWRGGVKANVVYPGTQSAALNLVACGDIDGDGSEDLFWRDPVTGANQIWLAAVKANKVFPGSNLDLTVNVVGAGDVNGDGLSDIVWYKTTNGAIQVWGAGLKANASFPGSIANLDFSPKAIGDYDGNGTADLVWTNNTTNATQIWGGALKSATTYPGSQAAGFTAVK